MILEFTPDSRYWLQLPASFPTASGQIPREWENEAIERMREGWGADFDPRAEPELRAALQHGLRQVAPADLAALQFWPGGSVANVIVHVIAWTRDDDGPRMRFPLASETELLGPPVVAEHEAPRLGTGLEVRYLIDAGGGAVLGGVSLLFENDQASVLVRAEPTVALLVAQLLDPLRQFVDGLRINDQGEGIWQPCTVDPRALAPTAEVWNFAATGRGNP